jgi:hypothetical protein
MEFVFLDRLEPGRDEGCTIRIAVRGPVGPSRPLAARVRSERLTRLRDVVELSLSGTKRVIDISDGGRIAAFLHLPDGIDLVSTRAGDLAATIQPGDLVLDMVPVRSGEDGLLTHVRTVVSRLVAGTSAVFLTRDAASHLPLDRMERVTTSVGCHLLEVAELAYPAWPAAVVVGCGVEPRVGEGAGNVATAVLVRGLVGLAPAPRTAAAAEPPDEDGIARLKAQLLERDQTIDHLEQKLAVIMSSAGYQLGAAVVEAVKSPSVAPRLPRRLVGIARGRMHDRAKAAVAQIPVAQTPATDVAAATEDSRLLGWPSEPVDRTVRPEIFSIVTDVTAEMLSHHSVLRRPMPHEARPALERTLPDVLLIQASALLAPAAWGHAGTPGGAVSNGRSLYDTVVFAGTLGVPVVVWQDVRPSVTPALQPVVRRADLVIAGGGTEPSWSPGVSLAAFHPTAKTSTDKVLVIPPHRAVAASAEARFRRELERCELATVRPLWSPGLFDDIRTHAVVLASPFGGGKAAAIGDLTLAAVASGARVLSGPNDALLGAFPSAVVAVTDPAAVTGTAEALLGIPELPGVERRRNLRHIFDFEATPVRLGWLAATLGLRVDPMVSRRVTVVVEAPDGRDTVAAIDNLLNQTMLPARILVAGERVPDRALDEVRALDIDIAVVESPRPWSVLSAATDTAWVMVWRNGITGAPRGLLHDLMAAAECVGADAVGVIASSSTDAGYGRSVDTLPVEGSLIRRELLSQLGPGPELGGLAPGLRLFAVHDAGSDR